MPQDIATYDHYTPGAWLLANPGVLDGEDVGRACAPSTELRMASVIQRPGPRSSPKW
jgi:hypothetical protein